MKPTKSGEIHLGYGVRGSLWAAGYHPGTDFVANYDPIYATKGGRIVFAGYHGGWGADYGNHIVIESTYKGITRRAAYCHLSKFYRTSGTVKDGEHIATSGATGHVTGPHLHYEERHSPYGYYDNAAPILLAYQPDTRPVIHLHRLKPGKTNLDVLKLKKRLNDYFPKRRPLRGKKFNEPLRRRYAGYQKNLGYEGKNANGIPGRLSLEKLGFRVLD